MLGGAGRYKNGDRKVQPQKKLGVAACWELASKVCYHILLTGLATPQATSNMWLSFTGVHESKMLCGDLLNLANRCAKHRVPLNLLTSLRCRCFGVDIREMPLGSAEPCLERAPFPALSYKTQAKEVVTFPYVITHFLDPPRGKVWDWITNSLLLIFSQLPTCVLFTCSGTWGQGAPSQGEGHLSSRSMLAGHCKTLYPLAEEQSVGGRWCGCPSASATRAWLSVPRWKNSPETNSGHFSSRPRKTHNISSKGVRGSAYTNCMNHL